MAVSSNTEISTFFWKALNATPYEPVNVIPSKNDIGENQNDILAEKYLKELLFFSCGSANKIIRGFTVTNPVGLSLEASPGLALIGGHLIESITPLVAKASGASNQYQYIRIDPDADSVTGLTLETTTTKYVRDKRRVMISKTEASGGSITSLYEEKDYGRGTLSGTYTGDGTLNRIVDIKPHPNVEVSPSVIMCCTADAYKTENIFSISSIESPGNRRTLNLLSPGPRLWFTSGIIKNMLVTHDVSASWTIDCTVNSYDETTISLPGIWKDSRWVIMTRFSATSVYQNGFLSGWVSDVAEITVRYNCNYHATPFSQAGTVYARAIRPINLRAFNHVNLDMTDNGERAPLIRKNGFEISAGADNYCMNKLGRTYNWLAIV